ncbi:MAG: DUF2279 domain-containing protein [Deltaproteobacteria bacterium]|nr:DUF2279 domain-containing protein [Deltaproteobacteria bacterium]
MSLLAPLLLAPLLWAQLSGTATTTQVLEPQGPNTPLIALASAGLSGLVLGVGTQAWWKDGLQAFSLRETGFLERDTYAGGADKLGHLYCTYVSMHIVASVYEELGMSSTASVWYAALFTGLLWNGFELIDGFTKYGFEYGDVVFNTLGIGLGALVQLVPEAGSLVGLRLGYVPSRDFLYRDKSFLKFINDYTGMTYYLDFYAKGALGLAGIEPGFLRYWVVGPIWSTEDYSPVRRHESRRRTFGFHVGLSLGEILREFGDRDPGVRAIARFFDFYAVPFLGVTVASDLNTGAYYFGFGVSNRSEIPL